jgi:quercetin dioxygenase-like cupin family protein
MAFSPKTASWRSASPFGIEVEALLTSLETKGQLTVAEHVVAPGATAPARVLPGQCQFIYVLEGRFSARLGPENLVLRDGERLYVPAGVISGYKNIGATSGRILLIITAMPLR